MKKDKGFELIYWNLSYRRKFIRTLWLIPFCIASVVLVWKDYHSIILTITYFLLLAVIGVIQAIYVFRKWKNGCDDDGIR